MDRVPVLKLGDFLLVSIQVDLEDHSAMALQEDLAEQIVRTRAHGVIIDISAMEIVDSFIGRMLSSIASISRVLDATTVVVGMRPAVAITLVELGLSLNGVRTALNVERGMQLLRQLRREDAAPDGVGAPGGAGSADTADRAGGAPAARDGTASAPPAAAAP